LTTAALETFLVGEVRDRSTSDRTRRPRRSWTYSLAGVAAAAIAVGIALSVGHSSSPPATPDSSVPPAHLAAFSVNTLATGQVTLTLPQSEIFDPVAVTAALRHAGVPALVTVGSVCTVPGLSQTLGDVISPPTKEPNGQTLTTITSPSTPI
jgi:hypothetical protein